MVTKQDSFSTLPETQKMADAPAMDQEERDRQSKEARRQEESKKYKGMIVFYEDDLSEIRPAIVDEIDGVGEFEGKRVVFATLMPLQRYRRGWAERPLIQVRYGRGPGTWRVIER